MKKWIVAVLFGVMLVLAACGGGNDGNNANDGGADNADNNNGVEENNDDADNNNGNETADADVDNGEDVYKQNCASCHGDDLSGGVGPELDTVGADLSVEEIEDIIENGKGSMPSGIVSGDDEADVAAWLATHK